MCCVLILAKFQYSIFNIQGYSKLWNSEPYKMSGDKSNFNIECNLCGTYTRVKSNKAIFEEYERIQNEWIGEYSETNLACPNEGCSADGIGIHKHGVTKSGSPRYRGTKCGKSFVISPITNRKQKRPEISELVFRLLINKMPTLKLREHPSLAH